MTALRKVTDVIEQVQPCTGPRCIQAPVIVVSQNVSLTAEAEEWAARLQAKIVHAPDLALWLRHLHHALVAKWPRPHSKTLIASEPPSAEELAEERALMGGE